jgi:hypothetical protein
MLGRFISDWFERYAWHCELLIGAMSAIFEDAASHQIRAPKLGRPANQQARDCESMCEAREQSLMGQTFFHIALLLRHTTPMSAGTLLLLIKKVTEFSGCEISCTEKFGNEITWGGKLVCPAQRHPKNGRADALIALNDSFIHGPLSTVKSRTPAK